MTARRLTKAIAVVSTMIASGLIVPESGSAKDLVFRPDTPPASTSRGTSKPSSAGNTPTKQRSTPAAGPACFVVTVTVDRTKLDGRAWDVSGSRVNPDPLLSVSTTGDKTTCQDSFSCAIEVRTEAASLAISILDKDLSAHDPIGSGSCPAKNGSKCKLGAASVSLKSC